MSGKVFIQRDYSSGTRCQFQTKFPAELENRVCCLAPRTCPGAREGDFSGKREGHGLQPWPRTVARLWEGADVEGALATGVRREPLSKTWYWEEGE